MENDSNKPSDNDQQKEKMQNLRNQVDSVKAVSFGFSENYIILDGKVIQKRKLKFEFGEAQLCRF